MPDMGARTGAVPAVCGTVICPARRLITRSEGKLAFARSSAGHAREQQCSQHGKYGELQEQDHRDVENLGHRVKETGQDAPSVFEFVNDKPWSQAT